VPAMTGLTGGELPPIFCAWMKRTGWINRERRENLLLHVGLADGRRDNSLKYSRRLRQSGDCGNEVESLDS
jgi:hypothetical protein